MYQKKIFQPTDTELHALREFMKTAWFQTLEKWAEWEYIEWCKYVSSLIPQLDILKDDDRRTLEKENDVITAVSEFFARVKKSDVQYIWESN
jgi:hypothetical protein